MNARLAALALVATSVLAAGPAPAAEPLCNPTPETAALLDQVGDAYDFLELSPEEWTDTLARVDAALAEHPADLFLHRTRQDLFRYARKDVKEERMPALREEYARLAKEHPGDPLFLYLAGRVAEDSEGEEAANVAAVEADPDFPWGHLGMVPVELKREEPDKEAAERHLARFADLCPDRVYEILVFSGSVGSPEFWKDRLPDLRRRISEDPQKNARSYSPLWALEFHQVDVTEHGAVRERIARDVEALATIEPKPRAVLAALKEGYELTGESEAAAEAEAALREVSPCTSQSVFSTLDAWEKEHPRPEGPDTGEAWVAWSRAADEAARGWLERCPNEYQFWNTRLHALAALDDADPEEVLRVGDRAAELYGEWQGYAFPSGYEQVAQVFLDKGIGLDRLIDLLDRAETETVSRRERRDLSRYPEDQRAELLRSDRVIDWTRDAMRARAHVARGELEEAEGLLAELAPRLEELAPGEDASGRAVLSQRGRESELWKLRAGLAEAAGHLPDTLAYLLQSEAVRPPDAPRWVQGLRPEEAEERISELWTRLGGGEDALAVLRASRAAAARPEELADFSPWEDADGALPAFELKDLSGRVWTPSDLAGKTVFANAWATWCGPCREELPAVQALEEKLAERDDVVVLTFNMDDNVGAVAPFLTEEGYDFPVLLALDYLRDDLGVYAIPQSWIVDGTGERRRGQRGFDPSVGKEAWIADAIAELEKVAATASAPETD